MSRAGREIVRFAGGTVAIQWQGDAAGSIVEFLCAHMPRAAAGQEAIGEELRLVSEAGIGRMSLYRGSDLLTRGENNGWLADRLLGEICNALAVQAGDGLLFHAAALAWRGHGLLLPGPPSAGKTTLAAWLALIGMTYLTDELAVVRPGSNILEGLCRPLNLKRLSLPVLEPWLGTDAGRTVTLVTPHGALVHPGHLPVDNGGGVPLRLVVFPRYQAGAAGVPQALSAGRAAVSLMACLVNRRNLPEHGLPDVARVARQIPAYRLAYSEFSQIGDSLERLLAAPAACPFHREDAKTRRKSDS